MRIRSITLAAALCLAPAAMSQTASVLAPLGGEPTAYQPVEIRLSTGLQADEADTSPNPFLDYRLLVEVTSPEGEMFSLPGYFAGDGAGHGAGDVWAARFSPTEPGEWSWSASFVSGPEVGISLDAGAGTAAPGDGLTGVFSVAEADAEAPGFFAHGRLSYSGEHYLRFADGSYFVKGGVDSPENWLGYRGFDNTVDAGGKDVNTPDDLHAFPTHEADWNPGDPDWDSPDTPESNDGRAIIGALNYLASTGVNSIYFLPMNEGGDAQDTWPWIDLNDPDLNYDISKLHQWDIFFTHAQRLGIFLHFVLNEAEQPNKQRLDGGGLGVERRLFYRELIARFGYHNALQWNICEEYNLGGPLFSQNQVREFADAIRAYDPFDRPIAVHNAGSGGPNGPIGFIIGDDRFDLPSIQTANAQTGHAGNVEQWRAATAAVGRPLPAMIDEPGSPTRDFDSDFDRFRKNIIWPVLASGGGGEWFINDRDQSLEDFREFDQIWRETGTAVRFFEENLPFWRMTPDDGLISGEAGGFDGAHALAAEGEVYLVYLPDASSPEQAVDLSGAFGLPTLRWFNPRTGQFEGDAVQLSETAAAALGLPPSDPSEDWVGLIEVDFVSDGKFQLDVVNGTGSGRYEPGEVVAIEAEVPPGFEFDFWAGFPVADQFAAATTLVMPASNAMVTANLELIPPPNTVEIVAFTLLNAATDEVLVPVGDGDVIVLGDLPGSPGAADLTLQAEVGVQTESVVFFRNGIEVQTENLAAFVLSGNSGDNYNPLNPPFGLGANNVSAVPYPADGGGGTPGSTFDVTFVLSLGACGPADINEDGELTFADATAFVAAFAAGDPAADRDGDGVVTFADVSVFLEQFNAGCP